MSVREEDKQKNCPSRGLGLAAAAIGVGVGAALYYFFSKRPENPDSEGSTSQGWSCERPQTFNGDSEADYTTITECSTSDTSIDDDFPWDFINNSDSVHVTSQTDDEVMTDDDSTPVSFTDDETGGSSLVDFLSEVSTESIDDTVDSSNGNSFNAHSDSDVEGNWDVTESSLDIPTSLTPSVRDMFVRFVDLVSPGKRDTVENQEEQRLRILREQAFRERSWSLEECSICFEIMLKNQELMALPCTHNFHVACIGPWLQEHQTCPVCRKAAE